jgi:hypothetical protein
MFFCDLCSQAFICLVFLVDEFSHPCLFIYKVFSSCYVMKQVKFYKVTRLLIGIRFGHKV